LELRRLNVASATGIDNVPRNVCAFQKYHLWASFWKKLGGNFHKDLATLPQLE